MANSVFKCRIEHDPDGNVRVTSYSNRKIHAHLYNLLNKAVHQAREDYNREAPWKKSYVRFSYDGITYEQVDANDLCAGCVFSSMIRCKHPYYLEGTKGDCTGKIYKQIKTT